MHETLILGWKRPVRNVSSHRVLWFLLALTCAEWKTKLEDHGITVMTRSMTDSAFDEHRLLAKTNATPQQILSVIWDHASYPRTMPFVRGLKLLSQAEDEHYAYLEIAMPVLKDRDYCMRYFRHTDERGVVTITGNVDLSGCPKERDEYVRIKRQNAAWTLTPTASGADVIYQVHSDLDGSVPAAIVNMSTPAEHAKFLRAILTAASKK